MLTTPVIHVEIPSGHIISPGLSKHETSCVSPRSIMLPSEVISLHVMQVLISPVEYFEWKKKKKWLVAYNLLLWKLSSLKAVNGLKLNHTTSYTNASFFHISSYSYFQNVMLRIVFKHKYLQVVTVIWTCHSCGETMILKTNSDKARKKREVFFLKWSRKL